jgi:hypothetical protein
MMAKRELTKEEHDRRILWSIVHQYNREGYDEDHIAYLVDKPLETVQRLLKCSKEEA